MKHWIGILALSALTPCAYADEPNKVLDTIHFELSAKQWVSTQKATLSVNINATLTDANLVKTRAEIMTRLNKIAKADWHLVAFERSQDNSGLEKLYVHAQAKVEQSALTDVYQQAKAVSQPGAQYVIGDVEFKPGLEERQAVKAKIREDLYQKINEELVRINTLYPNQHFSLNQVIFVEGEQSGQQRPYEAKALNAMAMSPAPLAVSNELILSARVEAASTRK